MSDTTRARSAVPVATVWTRPDAPRAEDERATRDDPDPAGWAAALDPSSRRDLGGRSLTQLLLGDSVLVLERRGPWARVVATDQGSHLDQRGYPGWVRRAHLTADDDSAASEARDRARVVAPTATCSTPSKSLTLSAGTSLPVLATEGRTLQVLLPTGETGRMRVDDVRLGRPSGRPAGREALQLAKAFTGLKYLWGGTSAWGLDCSGLVYLSFRVLDVLLPRDAADQWDTPMVDRIDPVEVRPGDLYFFARPGQPVHHVGFATSAVDGEGRRFMLHASGWDSAGSVIEQELDRDLLAILVGAGRVRV